MRIMIDTGIIIITTTTNNINIRINTIVVIIIIDVIVIIIITASSLSASASSSSIATEMPPTAILRTRQLTFCIPERKRDTIRQGFLLFVGAVFWQQGQTQITRESLIPAAQRLRMLIEPSGEHMGMPDLLDDGAIVQNGVAHDTGQKLINLEGFLQGEHGFGHAGWFTIIFYFAY